MRGDNAKLRAVDKAMGWVEPDGSSPASVAESLGVSSKIIGTRMGLPVVAWGSRGVWSHCVLNRYRFCTTTLLARTPEGLERLLYTLQRRVTDEETAKRWQPYYSDLWERRYRKWVCTSATGRCDCQLCEIQRAGRSRHRPSVC